MPVKLNSVKTVVRHFPVTPWGLPKTGLKINNDLFTSVVESNVSVSLWPRMIDSQESFQAHKDAFTHTHDFLLGMSREPIFTIPFTTMMKEPLILCLLRTGRTDAFARIGTVGTTLPALLWGNTRRVALPPLRSMFTLTAQRWRKKKYTCNKYSTSKKNGNSCSECSTSSNRR